METERRLIQWVDERPERREDLRARPRRKESLAVGARNGPCRG
jgi:hypothetical protein